MPPRTNRTRRLELKTKDLQKNTIALFKALERDEKARAAFVRDPAGHIAARVVKQRLPPQHASEANRLLFSILANDAMVEWLQAYGGRRAGKLDKRAFALDFVRQVQKLDDPALTAGVLGNAALGNGIPGLGPVAYQCVVNETPKKYDCACTPVAKNPLPPALQRGIDPEMLRVLTEHLVTQAKKLAQQGKLADLGATIA